MQIHGRHVSGYLRSADVEGSGGQAGQTPPRQSFSLEYVQELREEAKGNRVKLTVAEQALVEAAKATEQAVGAAAADTAKAKKEMADAISAAKAEAESHKVEVKTAADLRIIRAELKAEAVKAGMIDMDGLKLIDTSAVTIGEDGEVKIPDGFSRRRRRPSPGCSVLSAAPRPPKSRHPSSSPARSRRRNGPRRNESLSSGNIKSEPDWLTTAEKAAKRTARGRRRKRSARYDELLA